MKTKQKGVVAIEVAMGLFGFLLMMFYWMEVSYLGFVSSLMDYAVTEASRGARTGSSAVTIMRVFLEMPSIGSGSLWASFIDTEKFEDETCFYAVEKLFDELEELSRHHHVCDEDKDFRLISPSGCLSCVLSLSALIHGTVT